MTSPAPCPAPMRDDRMRLAHILGDRHDFDVNPVSWEDILARGIAFDLASYFEAEYEKLNRLCLHDMARAADETHFRLIEFAEREDEDTRDREREAWDAYENRSYRGRL